jgi:hypothetical protein
MAKTPTPDDIRAEQIILGKDPEYCFSEGIVRKVGPSAMCSADADEDIKAEADRINRETEMGPSEVIPGYAIVMPKGALADALVDKLLNLLDKLPGGGITFEDDRSLGLKTIKINEKLLQGSRDVISGRAKQ